MDPNEAVAAAHSESRLRMEAARTVLRMAIMFPDKMTPMEACERALEELDQVPQVGIILREVPVEVPYAQLPQQSVKMVQGLSGQQSKILRLVAEGFNNDEIAEQLFLSPMTIKSHLARVYKTLGVHNRAAAVAKMMEVNYVSDPGTN